MLTIIVMSIIHIVYKEKGTRYLKSTVQLKRNFKHRYVQRAYYLDAKFTCLAQRHLACRVLHTRHSTNTRTFAYMRACNPAHACLISTGQQ